MDLLKIGKFIASLRKELGITQEELAEKLFVTDRAVSKWERGLSLPDASKMVDLCNILGVNVNELLIGEKIDMKDYNKKVDELLVELTRQEEIKNKKILANMYVLITSTIIFYLSFTLLACATLKEGMLLGILIAASTIFVVIIGFISLKMEIDAGYYECKKCHHRYAMDSYFKAMIAPHMNTTRYLRCPKCGKKSWSKKVMTKE